MLERLTLNLSSGYFAKEWPALDFDEPCVFEGVATERPFNLTEHGVASELQSRQE